MTPTSNVTTIAWPLALAVTAIAGTLVTACMMPFVAVATLAAFTMPRGAAVITVLGVWATNQMLGFGLLGFPWDAYAASWGTAIGVASLFVLFVARRMLGASQPGVVRGAAAFGIGFVAFEALLLGFAAMAGGTGTFAPAIVLRLLANEMVWMVGLSALYAVLTRAAPQLFGRAPAPQFG